MARRRFRAFLFSATVILFLLYRVAQNSWDDPRQSIYAPISHDSPHIDQSLPANEDQDAIPAKDRQETVLAEDTPEATPANGLKELASAKDTQDSKASDDHSHEAESEDASEDVPAEKATKPTKTTSGSVEGKPGDANKIHWEPIEEHFPLPSESIRSLPNITGSVKIPKIQFDFKKSRPEAARSQRVERLAVVKEEIRRAWSAYRTHAWYHDELMPVSSIHRDPFCHWRATLVDSLDTLWLAGLREEFDEAAHEAMEIDFTWTPQNAIPVFETTIRYLGGLLGAIDVSGGLEGDYAFLLDKAVELAEILMGIFDTPNRMPILHYQWAPEFASQPRIATEVGIAELGTLSLEFTRLAQLTREPKYYDAVDRITDALVEMQNAGTAIPGLFPENIDASGCDRSKTSNHFARSQRALEHTKLPELSKPAVGYSPVDVAAGKLKDGTLSQRDSVVPSRASGPPLPRQIPEFQIPSPKPRVQAYPMAADGTRMEWDCEPRGLVPVANHQQKFHIGGSQDSAYEYFQKQYILLGGAEEKHKKLHLDSIKAINETLLYRPMIKDDDYDILFGARISTMGNAASEKTKEFGIDHLSCFIGGMYAMSGKLFEQEQDLKTAAQLTDGCVWAYGVTPSGIMPEGAHIMPCPTLEKCEFNETLWWSELDSSMTWRAQMVAEWDAKWGDQAQKPVSGAEDSPEKETTAEEDSKKDESGATETHEGETGSELPRALKDRIGRNDSSQTPTTQEIRARFFTGQGDDASNIQSRQLDSVLEANRLPPLDPPEAQAPAPPVDRPLRPLTHEEYVKNKIHTTKMPPGFVAIDDASYILRPEAIESVFYMYRITGDPSWQDKGWKMFEATIQATRTSIAHSAVRDVFQLKPAFKDQMESFWLAETLKYYYLLFSEPDVASLDEFVFNTEAHPFRRPAP